MTLPSWTADQAAAIQAITAIVQAVLTVIALFIAIYVPKQQYSQARKSDAERRTNELADVAAKKADEVAAIRLALNTEVQMVATQCLREFNDWCDAPQPPVQKNLRTAKFPPLAIYEGNTSKIGLLTRGEIVPLIAFSGTLHDLGVAVNEMAITPTSMQILTNPNQGFENQQTLKLLLSNACQKAADFLEVVPVPKAEKSSGFISELRKAEKAMDGAREKLLSPPSTKT